MAIVIVTVLSVEKKGRTNMAKFYKKGERKNKNRPSFCRNGRTCRTCKKYKLWTHFVTDKSSKSGLKSKCNECCRNALRSPYIGHNLRTINAECSSEEYSPRKFKVRFDGSQGKPAQCTGGSMYHRSSNYPTFVMPIEVIEDLSKRAVWDKYIEYHTRWWDDVLREERNSSNKRNI